jgi:hypothetical protein
VVLFHHRFDVLLTWFQVDVFDLEYDLTVGLFDQGIFGDCHFGSQDVFSDEEILVYIGLESRLQADLGNGFQFHSSADPTEAVKQPNKNTAMVTE